MNKTNEQSGEVRDLPAGLGLWRAGGLQHLHRAGLLCLLSDHSLVSCSQFLADVDDSHALHSDALARFGLSCPGARTGKSDSLTFLPPVTSTEEFCLRFSGGSYIQRAQARTVPNCIFMLYYLSRGWWLWLILLIDCILYNFRQITHFCKAFLFPFKLK